MTTKINLNKPLEAVHKTTGRIVPMTFSSSENLLRRGVFYTERGPCPETSNNAWYLDGRDYCHRNEWFIRNVVEEIDWSKPLALRGNSKVRVTFEGTLVDGRKVVKVHFFNGTETRIVPADGRVHAAATMTSGDDIVNKVEPLVKTYRNIYADGTIGTTEHKSYDECSMRSKYGKTRVGMLINETRGGVIVSSKVHPTLPKLRTSRNPGGINPFAA